MKRKSILVFIVFLLTAMNLSVANAEIKVVNNECPVYVSSHIIGSDILPYPPGNCSVMGLITGFSGSQFPMDAQFKTVTVFTALAHYRPMLSTLVLTDNTGTIVLNRYEFAAKFDYVGASYTQIMSWKVRFPQPGIYAFNMFIDGILVGYYPICVSSK